MSSFPHLSEPLTDGQVVLRDYEERDIPEILIAYQDDPHLHLRMGEERPPSGAELGRQAERERADRAIGQRAWLAILEPGSDTCLGLVRVDTTDWDQSRTEMGIFLAPGMRGRGLGRAALRLAGQWLLGPCGLARVELMIEPGDAAMLASCAAAGFAREGILREYLRQRGKRVDVVIMSLIRADV
ncbi:MAG: GNAT family N-acetyltransferase [Solirubrobacterales bacterium]|nr:GNAT family N-acetyltransferase [Solirubrobacterales bacterium]